MSRAICLWAAGLMLALPVLANPSWGVGGCYAPAQGLVRPAGRPIAQAPLPLRWITDARTPGQANLYLGTRQIGAWNHARQKYAPLTAAGWGPEQDVPPLANPPGCPRCADPSGECTCPPDNCGCPDCPISQAIKAPVSGQLKLWQIDGVDAHKIDGRAVDSHKVNGCKVPKAEAMAAIGRGELADDSGKLWVVCSHPDPAVRKKFADDYQSSPDLADLRTHAHLWAGPGAAPTSYLAKDRESKPLWAEGVSLLDPTGGELWHEAGYTPATLDNLRKADPHYTPDRSPGPHHPKKDDAAADDDYTLLLVAGAALALIFFLFGRPTHAA